MIVKNLPTAFNDLLQRYFSIRMSTFLIALVWLASFLGIIALVFVQITGSKDYEVIYIIVCLISLTGAGLFTRDHYKNMVGNNHVKDLTQESKIMCQIIINGRIFMAEVLFLRATGAGRCKVRVLQVYHTDMGTLWAVGDEIDVEGDQIAYLPPGM